MIAKGEDDCQGVEGREDHHRMGPASGASVLLTSGLILESRAWGEPRPRRGAGIITSEVAAETEISKGPKTNKQGIWFCVSVLPSLCIFLPLFSKASLLEMGFVKENRPGVGQKCQISDPAPESVFLAGASGE